MQALKAAQKNKKRFLAGFCGCAQPLVEGDMKPIASLKLIFYITSVSHSLIKTQIAISMPATLVAQSTL